MLGSDCCWSYIHGQGVSNRFTYIKLNLLGDGALVIVFSFLCLWYVVEKVIPTRQTSLNWQQSHQDSQVCWRMGWRREGAAKGAQALQGQGRWRLALAAGASSQPWTLLLGEENTCAACSGQIIPVLPTEQQWRDGYSCGVPSIPTALRSSRCGWGFPGASWHSSPSAALGSDVTTCFYLLVSLWDNLF